MQLRDKSSTEESFAAVAKSLRDVVQDAGALFVVNGRAALARDIGADGVHVPGGASVRDARAIVGPDAFVTSAAHDDADVARAAHEGASGVFVSPIFAAGKGPPRGTAALRSARAASDGRLRIYALGGVDAAGAAACAAAGADGIAVIRALFDVVEVEASARALGDPFRTTLTRHAMPPGSP